MIESGQADVIIAGGMENMSAAPYLLNKGRWGYRLGNGELVDSMLCDALVDAFDGCHMGITAERVAEKYNISRLEQDEFAASSQQKAQKALQSQRFSDEIVPVTIRNKKGEDLEIREDEYPRKDVTTAGLASLKAAFDKKRHRYSCEPPLVLMMAPAAILLMSDKKV